MSRGIHAPFSRTIVISPIQPKTSGGSFDLSDGQLGLFIASGGTNRGAKAVSSYQFPNKKYFLDIGTGLKTNQAGQTTKAMRTHLFSPKDVEQVTFSEAKKPTKALVYIGYDGFDTKKTLKLNAGESAEFSLTLTGEIFGVYGFSGGKYEAKFVMKADEADDCQETCQTSACHDRTMDLVERIKNRDVRNGLKIKDFIDVHPVISCAQDVTTPIVEANFYCLSLCDNGDDAALGLVQAQVPGYEVVRDSRTGNTTTYKVLGGDSAPSAYVDWKAAVKTECGEDCPDGYTSLGTGWYTVVTAHDSGSNIAATIDTAVETVYGVGTATVTKISGGQSYGKYIVLFTSEVDLTNLPVAYKALQDLQEVKEACVADETTSTEWTACGTCEKTLEYYYIDLEDDECGNSRIEELRKAYPQNTIVEAAWLEGGVPDGTDLSGIESEVVESDLLGACRRRYFTTAVTNIVCDECHPDTFTSEAPSAFGYEMWKKYELGGGAVGGVTVTSGGGADGTYEGVSGATDNAGDDATFNVTVDGSDVTVTVATGGKNFQIGDTITIESTDLGGGSDLVLTVSSLVEPSEDTDCLCGIMFRGKDIGICPDVDLAGKIGTINSQIEIQVSGGEHIGDRIGYTNRSTLKEGIFPVTRVSRAYNGSGWGHEYMQQEKMSYDYMLGVVSGDSVEERYFKNMRSKLEPCGQYDAITVKIKNSALSQGFSQTKTEYIRYIFIIPQGTKHIFDNFFNDVASGNPNAEVIYE